MHTRSYTRLGSRTGTRQEGFGSNPVAAPRVRPVNTGVHTTPAHPHRQETTKVHGGSRPRYAYLIRPENTGLTVHTATGFGSSSVAVSMVVGSKGGSDV